MKSLVSLFLLTCIFAYSCNNSENEASEKTAEIVTNADTSVAVTETTATPVPYNNSLEFEKIRFVITSPQSVAGNTFTVTPAGFEIVNDAVTLDCDGIITQTEVYDVDSDKAPELLIITQSGTDKKGKAYIFSSNRNKSMSMVSIPDFSADPKSAAGYMGHDDFAFVESSFSHRFPLYENGKPNGKTRQFQYKLKPGEASKKMVLDKMIEF
jgi:hypothetical protein